MEVNMNVAEDQLVIIKTLLEESIQTQSFSNVEEALSLLNKCIEDDFDTFMGEDDYLNVNDSQDFS
tara:strand:- start:153 stop:350 length:198 start_codon:yes stop_codon:yes gene_type:complete